LEPPLLEPPPPPPLLLLLRRGRWLRAAGTAGARSPAVRGASRREAPAPPLARRRAPAPRKRSGPLAPATALAALAAALLSAVSSDSHRRAFLARLSRRRTLCSSRRSRQLRLAPSKRSTAWNSPHCWQKRCAAPSTVTTGV
jgi:hypothetical protein